MTYPTRFFRLAACAFLLAAWSFIDAQGQSLYADRRARQAGDPLTIVLAERTDAQRESGFQNRSNASLGGGGSIDGDDGNLSGRFGLDASFNKEARNRNETVQRDMLRGTFTALVVDVTPTGNLVVRGERTLNVNGITHLMRVSGQVRPLDVRTDNSVLSYEIANADIEYRRDGLGRGRFGPAFFTRVGLLGVLGGAIAYAVTN